MPDLIITEALVERCARAMYEATVANAGPHRAKFDALPAYWRKTLATQAPPQPEPQPGEAWEVTRAGKKVREVVSASGTHFLGVVDAVHDTCHVGNIAPSERRLLITADGEWVGGES